MTHVLIIGREGETSFVERRLRSEIHVDKVISFQHGEKADINLGMAELQKVDYIIIAINDEDAYNLFDALNINEEIHHKLLDFYSFARAVLPRMTVDRVMANPLKDEYKAVMLGLSHSEFGIIPEMFPCDLANLSVSAQDIFYNYASFLYAMEKYSDKFKEIEYFFFDLFDYTYFNYDTSLGKNALAYLVRNGGILLPHNYDKNSRMKTSYEYAISRIDDYRYQKITEFQVKAWNTLITDEFLGAPLYEGYRNNPFMESVTWHYESSREKTENFLNTSLIKKRHEDTISENQLILSELFKTIRNLFPKARIIALLCPQYDYDCRKESPEMELWKTEFMDIIGKMSAEYGVEFWDYKRCEISDKSDLFKDINHLNYFGAQKFTEIIVNRMSGLEI